MAFWRDIRGRFKARRSPSPEAVAEPELVPMAAQSLEWLVSQPDVRQRLLGLLDRPARERQEARGPVDARTELVEKAAGLAAHAVQRIDPRDKELQDLHNEGYMQESLGQIVEFAARMGISLRAAASALEQARGHPEPAVSSGRHWRFVDRAGEASGDAALKELMSGNDEAWLDYAVPAALRESRERGG